MVKHSSKIKIMAAYLLAGAMAAGAQAFPWSQSPPGKLAAARVPMFVVFGFDDNARVEGVQWFANLVRNRKNPAGTGNHQTYDGLPIRSTWFLTGNYIHSEGFINAGNQTLSDLISSWKGLYNDGHEIANHTWSHPHGSGLDLEAWKNEVRKTTDHLASTLGISADKIKGFRTPYLEYTPTTLSALKDLGFQYDASIEFGFNGWQPLPGDSGNWNGMTNPETHKKLFWPYTLDAGSPPGNASKGNPTIPGLWEVPVNTFLKSDNSGEVTGFDFNLWKISTKEQFVAALKYNFDLRRAGNHAPLTVNVHSDYYTQYNDDANKEFTFADWKQRQQGMEEFLEYILTFPETRIVSYKDMIAWMKNPVPMGGAAGFGVSDASLATAALSLKTAPGGALELSLPAPGSYRLSVFSPQGRLEASLARRFEAGKARVSFGRNLRAGVYFVELGNGVNQVRRKVVLTPL